jgi:hypothetical protein
MLEAGGQPTKVALVVVNPVNSVSVKFLAAVLAAGILGLGTAGATTSLEMLGTFGFFGTWATNCHKPASPSNKLRTGFVSATGDAMFSESLGADSEPNVYVILKAYLARDGNIVLHTKLNGVTEQELIMRMDGDRLRTLSNRDIARRKYIVRNGRVVSSRHPTPWLTHCTGVP